MSQQVIIFDTTLRDGEQALQASLSAKEKLQIALALERMGVDVMEVGFPVSSPGDFESVQTIARQVKNSRVCALARCVEKDIDVAAESLKVAEAFRIHTFIATSPMHIATKLRSTLDEVIERAIYMVKRARNYTDDVEFSCEDAGRTPIADLARVVEAAINAGATTINIPDTVGYTMPFESLESSAACMNACLTSTSHYLRTYPRRFRPGSWQLTGGGTCRSAPGGRCNEWDRRASR
ncbi:2-isopropylmalate synthase [Escherichia coli]|uniref:2-isopropylmalate synthase n=1 Tax=Escherichia coli TaxID=562 RepID=A0A376LHN0_ECOLX|nr:2-isopropylmalate synthase [Escherichia coli]